MWQEAVQTEDGNEYPVFKLMLQKIDSSNKPAYWKCAGHTARANDVQDSFLQYTCVECGKNSPTVFKNQSAICLNRDCTAFFLVNGVRLQRHTLEYREEFLNWIKPFSGDRDMIPDIVPLPPIKDSKGYGTELRCRTGMVCPECHHCDSRVFFSYWKCISCGLVHMAEPDPFPMADIDKETQGHTKKLLKSKNSELFKEDGTTIFMLGPGENDAPEKSNTRKTAVTKKKAASNKQDEEPETKGFVTKFSAKDERSTRTTYMIFDPNNNFIGSLVHERPTAALKGALCGAHELWNKIQEPGVTKDFKRNAARCSGSKSFHSLRQEYQLIWWWTGSIETLTRHFTQNFVRLLVWTLNMENFQVANMN